MHVLNWSDSNDSHIVPSVTVHDLCKAVSMILDTYMTLQFVVVGNDIRL